MNRINALSMFSGGGIAETYFEDVGIDVQMSLFRIEQNFIRLRI